MASASEIPTVRETELSWGPPTLGEKLADTTGRPESEFRNEWKDLIRKIRKKEEEQDPEKRFSPNILYEAYEIASDHPESVRVDRYPMGRKTDMVNHVRKHFDTVFNSEDVNLPSGYGPKDVEKLLRICEVIYLDDATLRFSNTNSFDPLPDGLGRIEISEFPPIESEWPIDAERLWIGLGEFEPDANRSIEEMTNQLYEERSEFVQKAKGAKMFLPVPSTYLDKEARKRKESGIRTRLMRGHEVDAEMIHDICFSRVIDEFDP